VPQGETDPLQQSSPASSLVNSPEQKTLKTIIGVALHALVVISVVLVFIWLEAMRGGFFGGDDHPFNWHPMLMVLAFGFLESEAIVAFILLPLPHQYQKLVHILFHSFAIVSVGGALLTVSSFHEENNIPDLYSLHSWCGTIVLVAFVVQYVVGFGVFVWPGISPEQRVRFVVYHRAVGITLYLGAMMTIFTGFIEKQTLIQQDPNVDLLGYASIHVNFTALCFPVIAILVCMLLFLRHNSQKTLAATFTNFGTFAKS